MGVETVCSTGRSFRTSRPRPPRLPSPVNSINYNFISPFSFAPSDRQFPPVFHLQSVVSVVSLVSVAPAPVTNRSLIETCPSERQRKSLQVAHLHKTQIFTIPRKIFPFPN